MNFLQKLHAQTIAKLDAFSKSVIAGLLQGKPFDKETWLRETSKITEQAVLQSAVFGLDNKFQLKDPSDVWKHYLDKQFEGGKLSTRLRDSAKEAERIVNQAMKDALTTKSNWQAVAKELTKAGVSKGDIPKSFNRLSTEILKNSGMPKGEYNKLLRDAQRRLAGLKEGSSLRPAYERVIRAVEKGNPIAVQKAIENAVSRKAIYNNERIARTETARAWNESFMRSIIDDKDITAVRYSLSMGHPLVDYCDFYAESDGWGLGAGIYPKHASPQIPTHCNCLCVLQAINMADLKGAKFSQKDAQLKLEALGIPKYQQRIIMNGEKLNGNNITGGTPLALPEKFVEPVKQIAPTPPQKDDSLQGFIVRNNQLDRGTPSTKSGVFLGAKMTEMKRQIIDGINDIANQYKVKFHHIGYKSTEKTRGTYTRTSDELSGTVHISKKHPSLFSFFKNSDWSISSMAVKEKSIYTTTVHEAFHGVYYQNKLQQKWTESLSSFGVTSKEIESISKYAVTSKQELFSEVGAKITLKMDVPENIKKAFEETVKGARI